MHPVYSPEQGQDQGIANVEVAKPQNTDPEQGRHQRPPRPSKRIFMVLNIISRSRPTDMFLI
jgi:hypothetical protein